MGTKKKAREGGKKEGVFFRFLAGKICLLCFAQKHTDMCITFFVKVGGEAFNSLSRLFTSSNDDNVSTTRTIITTAAKKRAHDDAM